jgi:aryl-alcohol dehydrogenase-like predicted oxidoreductase
MKQRTLGRSGLRVSILGLGTATFGSFADEAAAREILDRAAEAGITLLDLAETYPVPSTPDRVGRSEEIVGRWLRGRRREDVLLATKVAGPPAGVLRWPVRGGDTRLDRASVARALEGSLRRLGTDFVDLYQTHRPDPDTPRDETLDALAACVSAGKARAVGVCNESPVGLGRLAARAQERGDVRIDAVQCSLSLLAAAHADALARVCSAHDVSLLGYSPLAGGVLSGKYLGGARPAGSRFASLAGDDEVTRQAARVLDARSDERVAHLARVASRAGLALPTLAVAWALAHAGVAAVLVGATHAAQLEPLLAAAEVVLPPEVLAACAPEATDA